MAMVCPSSMPVIHENCFLPLTMDGCSRHTRRIRLARPIMSHGPSLSEAEVSRPHVTQEPTSPVFHAVIRYGDGCSASGTEATACRGISAIIEILGICDVRSMRW